MKSDNWHVMIEGKHVQSATACMAAAGRCMYMSSTAYRAHYKSVPAATWRRPAATAKPVLNEGINSSIRRACVVRV
jgi:hypothetical protein